MYDRTSWLTVIDSCADKQPPVFTLQRAHPKYNQKQNTQTTFCIACSQMLRIFIFILSLTALLLLVDTLKNPLNKIFPGLELILFNLYETMKDIVLFVKDLT